MASSAAAVNDNDRGLGMPRLESDCIQPEGVAPQGPTCSRGKARFVPGCRSGLQLLAQLLLETLFE